MMHRLKARSKEKESGGFTNRAMSRRPLLSAASSSSYISVAKNDPSIRNPFSQRSKWN